MKLFAVGLNHQTAPVELREQLAIPREQLGENLPGLVRNAKLEEIMLLSTCNRVELYGVDRGGDPRRVVEALAHLRGVPRASLSEHCFVRDDKSAARHIFRVAASLESMIVGEPQILGQVKDAYQAAREVGTVGAVLDRCLTMAFRGAKRVRTETGIARGAASVPSVAVDLAVSIFGELGGRRVLLVGAGEMSEQAALHLRSAGATVITVVNRTPRRGEDLAQAVHGRFAPWDALAEELTRADIVVSSTGSSEPVIDYRMMKKVMRTRRGAPMFIVDIAVPRDVEQRVGKLEQVFSYNVDDLQDIVHENMENRAAEAELASRVVDEEVTAFLRWGRTRAAAPVLRELQAHGRGIVSEETQRALQKLGDLAPEQQKIVATLAHQVMQKLLHRPMSTVREAASSDAEGTELAGSLARLFGLDRGQSSGSGASEPEHEEHEEDEEGEA